MANVPEFLFVDNIPRNHNPLDVVVEAKNYAAKMVYFEVQDFTIPRQAFLYLPEPVVQWNNTVQRLKNKEYDDKTGVLQVYYTWLSPKQPTAVELIPEGMKLIPYIFVHNIAKSVTMIQLRMGLPDGVNPRFMEPPQRQDKWAFIYLGNNSCSVQYRTMLLMCLRQKMFDGMQFMASEMVISPSPMFPALPLNLVPVVDYNIKSTRSQFMFLFDIPGQVTLKDILHYVQTLGIKTCRMFFMDTINNLKRGFLYIPAVIPNPKWQSLMQQLRSHDFLIVDKHSTIKKQRQQSDDSSLTSDTGETLRKVRLCVSEVWFQPVNAAPPINEVGETGGLLVQSPFIFVYNVPSQATAVDIVDGCPNPPIEIQVFDCRLFDNFIAFGKSLTPNSNIFHSFVQFLRCRSFGPAPAGLLQVDYVWIRMEDDGTFVSTAKRQVTDDCSDINPEQVAKSQFLRTVSKTPFLVLSPIPDETLSFAESLISKLPSGTMLGSTPGLTLSSQVVSLQVPNTSHLYDNVSLHNGVVISGRVLIMCVAGHDVSMLQDSVVKAIISHAKENSEDVTRIGVSEVYTQNPDMVDDETTIQIPKGWFQCSMLCVTNIPANIDVSMLLRDIADSDCMTLVFVKMSAIYKAAFIYVDDCSCGQLKELARSFSLMQFGGSQLNGSIVWLYNNILSEDNNTSTTNNNSKVSNRITKLQGKRQYSEEFDISHDDSIVEDDDDEEIKISGVDNFGQPLDASKLWCLVIKGLPLTSSDKSVASVFEELDTSNLEFCVVIDNDLKFNRLIVFGNEFEECRCLLNDLRPALKEKFKLRKLRYCMMPLDDNQYLVPLPVHVANEFMSRNLLVYNLPKCAPSIIEEALKQLVQDFAINIELKTDGGRCSVGYAFITCHSSEESAEVYRLLNGETIKRNTLCVKYLPN